MRKIPRARTGAAAEAETMATHILRSSVRIVSDQLQVEHEVAPAFRPATAEQIDDLTARRYPELIAAVVDVQARIYAAYLLAGAPRKKGEGDGG